MRVLSLLPLLFASTAVGSEPAGMAPRAGGPAAAPAQRGSSDVSPERPVMAAQPAAGGERPPSRRELVDARAVLRARYREPLFQADTAAGANRAAEIFVEAAAAEPDRGLKWLLCAEARRMGVAAGNAVAIHRAITLASATYEFDALAEELRDLAGIPLRPLSPPRAAALAEAAEAVAGLADVDGRADLALAAQELAIKGWQRAGAKEACRLAMLRHAEMAAGPAARPGEASQFTPGGGR